MTAFMHRLTRQRHAALWMLICLAALPVCLPAQTPANAPAPTTTPGTLTTVREVSRVALPRGERISIEFSDEVTYLGDRVPNPDRVYFDFKNSLVAAPVVTAAQALGAGPLVKSVRIARHTEQTTRLVLELGGHPRYSVFQLYNPFRLVIDVEGDLPPPAPQPSTTPSTAINVTLADSTSVRPTDALLRPADAPATASTSTTAATKAAGLPSLAAEDPAVVRDHPKLVTFASPPPAAAMSRGDYSLARQLGLGVSRIVIDAGHGGHDPGAQSNGINESELVLDVALRLEKLLKDQPGLDVVLTRRTDEFIPLEERTAIANREGADVFLSIHANASRLPTARGIETYFLNFSTNPTAEAVAARENATSTRTMGNLPELVKTIALNNKVAESRELATIVQDALVRRLRAQSKTLQDLGVKQAPFVVLIGAQMPSVLAEISFITNKPDAALLKESPYRQRIAQALFDAVVKYQGSLKTVTTVAAKGDRE